MGRGQEEINSIVSGCFHLPGDASPLSDDLDNEIMSSLAEEEGSGAIALTASPGSMYKTMSSHVLLGACQPRETASESQFDKKWAGVCTRALISALLRWRTGSISMSYLALIGSLSAMPNQHPHCEGYSRIRYLFSLLSAGEDPTAFVVTSGDDKGSFYIAAGNIHGICIGTEFMTQPCSGKQGSICEPLK